MSAALNVNRGPARAIRPMVDDDVALIHHSWRASYRDERRDGSCNDALVWVPNHIYWPEMIARINKLLRKPDVRVMCSVSSKDANQVFGWCCYEPDALHYVYIKEPFRRLGIATELVLATGFFDTKTPAIPVTHWTRAAEKIPREFRYRPSILGERRTSK